jgi:hypothetical protein
MLLINNLHQPPPYMKTVKIKWDSKLKCYILGCDAVWYITSLSTFHINFLPLPSGPALYVVCLGYPSILKTEAVHRSQQSHVIRGYRLWFASVCADGSTVTGTGTFPRLLSPVSNGDGLVSAQGNMWRTKPECRSSLWTINPRGGGLEYFHRSPCES